MRIVCWCSETWLRMVCVGRACGAPLLFGLVEACMLKHFSCLLCQLTKVDASSCLAVS